MLALLIVALALVGPTAMAAPLPPPSYQIAPPESRLARLLRSLPADATGARWELANIALEALYEVYASALRASMRESPRSVARRDKLRRWQAATRELMAGIQDARQRLLVGNDFSLLVDPQSQVIIAVEGRLLALTGLGRGDDHRLEQTVVERYCALNPCAFMLERDPPVPRASAFGHWEITQGLRPIYRIDGLLGCRFEDLSDRRIKSAACQGAANDLRQLRERLNAAVRRGQTIDWPLLAASRREAATGILLILNASGAYLTVELPYLARLDGDDWQRLIDWLAFPDRDGTRMPVIAAGGRLLSD